MLTSGSDVVARWKFLYDLDVGDQSSASENPLQKVVAEERIVGNSPAKRRFEDVDVIDPRARLRALAEQILVHVGDGKGIGVHARRT